MQGVSPLANRICEQIPPLVDAIKVELAEQDPFDATAQEPVVGHGGVYFDVFPKQRFAALRDGVRRGMAGVMPLVETHAPYEPHLAVAHATGAGPIASVDPSLLRVVTDLSWHVDAVLFVELRRTPRQYLWDVLAEVPLRGH